LLAADALLSAHAELLARGDRAGADALARRTRDPEMASLMRIARRARAALPSARPSAAFREALKSELGGVLQAGGGVQGPRRPPARGRRRAWQPPSPRRVVAALAGGVAACAGLALILRGRPRRSSTEVAGGPD
jgi:hypothetical protein